jgi:hypothetical protein
MLRARCAPGVVMCPPVAASPAPAGCRVRRLAQIRLERRRSPPSSASPACLEWSQAHPDPTVIAWTNLFSGVTASSPAQAPSSQPNIGVTSAQYQIPACLLLKLVRLCPNPTG